jgi:hypothetical protein
MSTNVVESNPKDITLGNPLQNTFINPLPRAVYRRNSHLLLDGEWRFLSTLKIAGSAKAGT